MNIILKCAKTINLSCEYEIKFHNYIKKCYNVRFISKEFNIKNNKKLFKINK